MRVRRGIAIAAGLILVTACKSPSEPVSLSVVLGHWGGDRALLNGQATRALLNIGPCDLYLASL
jgi:hypothetical protein